MNVRAAIYRLFFAIKTDRAEKTLRAKPEAEARSEIASTPVHPD